MKRALIATLLCLAAPALAAAPERDVCPSFAGLDTGPCTTEAGHLTFELLGPDYIRNRTPDSVTDTLEVGHFLLRAGLTSSTEVQAEWEPYGHVRTRDRATGVVNRQSRVGDVTLGLRQNLRNPDGKGASFAVQPFVTLPVGRTPLGAGDWGAGVIVPLSFDLPHGLNLTFDPEVDAAVDEDAHGRHLAYGGVVSLSTKLTEKLEAQLDYEGFRDRDPLDHATTHRVAGTFTYQPGRTLAVFSTAAFALDHDAQNLQLFVGVARLF